MTCWWLVEDLLMTCYLHDLFLTCLRLVHSWDLKTISCHIKGFQCLISNKVIRLTISRGQKLILLLAIIQVEKKILYFNLWIYTSLQKVQYLLNESSDLCKVLNVHISLQVGVFTTFYEIFLGVQLLSYELKLPVQ